jgi:hypothetical protein
MLEMKNPFIVIKLNRSQLSVSRVVNASSQEAWDFLTDTRKWRKWGPTVIDVDCALRYIHKGASGHVRIPSGQWLRFVITKYEQGHYWSWMVASVTATGHRVNHIDEKSCRISFEVPILWAPYIIVCWVALKRIAGMLETSKPMGSL